MPLNDNEGAFLHVGYTSYNLQAYAFPLPACLASWGRFGPKLVSIYLAMILSIESYV